jgi:hypothetical protein
MSHLTAKTRAQLRNAAFAYVDSKGRRRLPIHDEAHVRNALARFNQTRFEDDAARERARKRLLTAAKKYGIVPIGFIAGQLATERQEGESRARAGVVRGLPSGRVTFLLTDIENSTGLLRLLEDRYANLLDDVRRLLRRAVQRSGGKEVDNRADELFAVFKRFQLEAPDLPANFPAPRTTKGSFQPFDEPAVGAHGSNPVTRTRSRSR